MTKLPKPEFFFKGFPEDVRFRCHTVPDSLEIAKGTLYEAWFTALKISPLYLECIDTGNWLSEQARKTFQTFGDLREVHFEEWWVEKGYSLFAEQRPFPRIVVDDGKTELGDMGPTATLVVPLNVSPTTLKRQFADILKNIHPHHSDFDRWKVSSAPVKLTNRKLTSVSISNYLKVYEEWLKKQDVGIEFHLYDLGYELRLNPKLTVLDTDYPNEATDKRTKMSVMVSEYLQKAKRILAHATEGRFPCTEEHHWLRDSLS